MSAENHQPESIYSVGGGALLEGRRKLSITRSIVKFLQMGINGRGTISPEIENDTINLVDVIGEQLAEAEAHYLAYEEAAAQMRRQRGWKHGPK